MNDMKTITPVKSRSTDFFYMSEINKRGALFTLEESPRTYLSYSFCTDYLKISILKTVESIVS